MTLVEAAILTLGAMVAIAIVIATLRIGIAPMPSSRRASKAIVETLPNEFAGELLELGSGWGGLACAIAKRRPGARVIGFERSWIPWAVSRLRARLFGRRRVAIRLCDFRNSDLGAADAVVCYLFPGAMERLADKLRDELRPGTLIVSHTFRLPGWTPQSEKILDDLFRTRLYVYVA